MVSGELLRGEDKLRAIALLLCGLAVLGIPVAASGQSDDAVATWQLFSSGEYSRYLEHIDEELGNRTPEWLELNLPKIAAAAVSLDKTGQRDGEVAKQVESLISPSANALRYYRATTRLLLGDVEGVSLFFEGVPPRYSVWLTQAEQFRRHGYELAANAFTVLYMTGSTGLGTPQEPRVVEAGVKALAAFPPQQRAVLADVVASRLRADDNWYCRQVIAQTAMRLCRRSDLASAEANLDIAMRFGSDLGVFSISNAEALLSAGKPDQAVTVAKRAGELSSESADVQCQVGRLLNRHADRQETLSFYEAALNALSEPQVRDLRVQYLQYLCSKGPKEEIAERVRTLGALGAADEKLLEGTRTEAATAYRAIVRNEALLVGRRIDAWAGWLRSSPKEAVDAGQSLISQAKSADSVVWLARQVWETLAEHKHIVSGRNVVPRTGGQGPADAVDDLLPQFALLVEKAIAVAPEACLCGESPESGGSLRVPAAVLLAASTKPEKAVEVLTKPVCCEIPPPPGGWKGPPGMPPPPDANEPRRVTTPGNGDVAKWGKEVIDLLNRLGASADVVQAMEMALASAQEPAGDQ